MLPLASAPIDVPLEIYIMAGQSNSSGRGDLGDVPTLSLQSHVRNFSNAWEWIAGQEPIDDGTNQVDSVSYDDNAWASAGMSFAVSISELRPNRLIGLVPCGMGGTGLTTDWARSLSRTTLYGSMIARALKASESGELKGLLWYQGEQEGNTASSNYATYASDWLSWFADVRNDLGIADLPACVTILSPGPSSGFSHWGTVQNRIASLDGALSNTVAAVDASDLDPRFVNDLHLDTPSLVILGQRYATAMDALIEGTYGS